MLYLMLVLALLSCPNVLAFLPTLSSSSSSRCQRKLHQSSPQASSSSCSSTSATDSATTSVPSLLYTHLEINSMLWQIPDMDNLSLLIDPIAGQLDFGIAPLYRANKKYLTEPDFYAHIDDAAPTHVLLTQGLDDHTHLPTLRQLVQRHPHLHYIAPPSAKEKVRGTIPHDRFTVLRHGETFHFSDRASVTATVGSLVGPPWQERENGYVLKLSPPTGTTRNDDQHGTTTTTTTTTNQEISQQVYSTKIYYEPHGDTLPDELRRQGVRADVCVLPVTQQTLPAQLPRQFQYTIIHGPERMRDIVQALGAHTIVPLGNGDLDTAGPVSKLVASSRDSLDDFAASLPEHVQVVRPGVPGQALTVNLFPSDKVSK